MKTIFTFILTNWTYTLIVLLLLAVGVLAFRLTRQRIEYIEQEVPSTEPIDESQGQDEPKSIIEHVLDFTRGVLTWNWTKRLLHWIIISAGTMSECVFLIASLWVSINANVHKFVLLFISDQTATHLTELATTAYVALPECIVGLAVVVTLSHVRLVMYNHRDYKAVIWSVLYGMPTLVFMLLSLITLGCSVASVTFEMPTGLVVVRALAGYVFAFTSLLYTQLGVPQEKDRLAEKDAKLEKLRQVKDEKTAALERENARLNGLIEQQNQNMQRAKRQQEELINAVNKSSDDALAAYSDECKVWLRSGVKSVSVDEVTQFTGHSKRKINNAMSAGKFQSPGRNKDLILVSSLVEWLKDNPPTAEKAALSSSEISVDKLDITLSVLKDNPNISDEALAPLLNLNRPASARFWRLKAIEMLRIGQEKDTEKLEAPTV